MKLCKDWRAIIVSAGLATISAPAHAADPQEMFALTSHDTGWLMKQCDAVLQKREDRIPGDLAFALGQCFGYIQGVVDHSRVLFDFPEAVVVLSPHATPARPLGICPDQYNAGVEEMARQLLRQYSPAQNSTGTDSLAAWWIGSTLAAAYPCKVKSPTPAKAGEARP